VESALRALDEAIELKPDYAVALYERGMLRALAGMTEEALEDFGGVVKLRPEDSKAYNNLGCLHFNCGQTEEAEASFKMAVDTWEGNWEAKKNLADLYLQTGRAQQAMNLYSLIIDQHPKCPEVYVSLGRMFAACGDLGTGEQCFRTALRLDPDDTEAKQGLSAIGLARAQAENPEETKVETQESQ
jgi:protein O-GlcNAc transferase